MTDEGKKLRDILAGIYERYRNEIRVSPSWLATEAMLKLDPDQVSPHLVYIGCHLELRQLAREFCRGKFMPAVDDIIEPDDLFPDLQKRYPSAQTADDEEPNYVLLDHMTDADIAFNVARLRSEAEAKLRHADRLEDFGRARKVA